MPEQNHSSTNERRAKLLAVLSTLPRFGPPARVDMPPATPIHLRSTIAAPVQNIVAAKAMFAAVTQDQSPFRLADVVSTVGPVLADLRHDHAAYAAWTHVQEALQFAVDALKTPQLRQCWPALIERDAGMSSYWAALAWGLSKALIEVEDAVRALPAIDPNAWLTVAEVAIKLSVSEQLVYDQCTAGKLPYKRIGGAYRFEWDEVRKAVGVPCTDAANDKSERKPAVDVEHRRVPRGTRKGKIPGTGIRGLE